MQQLSTIWIETFDPADVQRSWAAFFRTAAPVMREGHEQSAGLAMEYFNAFREATGAPGSAVARKADPLDINRARDALEYSAKTTTLRGIAVGRSVEQASQAAFTRTLGSAGRLVSEGGRQTVIDSVRDDPARPSWQRIPGEEPCEFCAMLSARGAVYRRSTAHFEAHDHCSCEAEPVYGERELDDRQQEWMDLWRETAEKVPKNVADRPREQLAVWRRAYREHRSSFTAT